MNGSGAVRSCRELPIAVTLLVAVLASVSVQSIAAQETPSPVTVKTDNESVNVIVSWDVQEIEPGQEVEFTLDFQHPFSGQSLPHVNYDFEIMDGKGNVVESQTDLHSHIGRDIRSVTFEEVGSFSLVVTILGTGLDPPFDTTRSGTAQMPITVVPEFQLVAPAVLAAATAIGIAIARIRRKATIS